MSYFSQNYSHSCSKYSTFPLATSNKMYSKSGKSFKHKFQILLTKDQILSNDLSVHPRLFNFKKRLKTQTTQNPPSTSPKSSIPKSPNFIFKQPGREKSSDNRQENPPPGYYNCNYSLVLKSPTSCIFKKEPKKFPRNMTPTAINDSFDRYLPSKKQGFISFTKQVPRKENFVKELNENRFVSFENMPETCSKYKSTHVPDISKFSERKSIVKSAEFLPSYRPDYKLVKEDIGKVHEFSKYSPRKPLFEEMNQKVDERYNGNWKKKPGKKGIFKSLEKLVEVE